MEEIVNFTDGLRLLKLQDSSDILKDACNIIEIARQEAYRAVNLALVQRNWLLGKRIAIEVMNRENHAENYGLQIIEKLSQKLIQTYGKGFTKTNLYSYYSFYKQYPDIFHSVGGKCFSMLSWTHYRVLLQVKDSEARSWYEKESVREAWSARTLQRNISSQYYYRLLNSQIKDPVSKEMKKYTETFQNERLEFIKNPVVVEFLGLTADPSFTETKLETSIISNLQKKRMPNL